NVVLHPVWQLDDAGSLPRAYPFVAWTVASGVLYLAEVRMHVHGGHRELDRLLVAAGVVILQLVLASRSIQNRNLAYATTQRVGYAGGSNTRGNATDELVATRVLHDPGIHISGLVNRFIKMRSRLRK